MPPDPQDARHFDPSKPAVLHDKHSDAMIAWTAERKSEFRQSAARGGLTEVLEWTGAVFGGWAEALGG
jgi:hypothetical protein